MVVLDGESLRLEDVGRVIEGEAVQLSGAARARMEASRLVVEDILRQRRPVYAVSTGVGNLCTVAIPAEDIRALQRNIVRSHAAGVGPAVGEDVVRAMLLLRANALASGYSGVRPALVDTLVSMLNRRVHPVVPEQGSLGASGDLAPLAHLALVVMGEGEAFFQGERLAGGEAMRRAGIPPLALEPKEGIALINGTQFMSALGTLFLLEAERLVAVADAAGALTIEALRGTDTPFHPHLQRVRPTRGRHRRRTAFGRCCPVVRGLSVKATPGFRTLTPSGVFLRSTVPRETCWVSCGAYSRSRSTAPRTTPWCFPRTGPSCPGAISTDSLSPRL
jgi:histidine ammonia-lyase